MDPEEHVEHEPELPYEYVLLVQLEQPAANVVPEFVTVPRKPIAQIVQEVTEILPLDIEEIPAGQDVQLDASDAE